jgi:hypothetical protein
MAAVNWKANTSKRVFQVDISARLIDPSDAADFASAIRNAGREAIYRKSKNEVDRVVVVLDVAGSVGCDYASFKALSMLFNENDHSFVDVITRVFIVNADDALRTAWYLASSVPPANQFAQLITLL